MKLTYWKDRLYWWFVNARQAWKLYDHHRAALTRIEQQQRDLDAYAGIAVQLAKVQPQIDEMRLDAQRYLWLKECTAGDWEYMNDVRLSGASMDAEIDALLSIERQRRARPGSESDPTL